jgi:hypothetical protein
MLVKLTIDEIIAKNPNINAQELEESQRLLEELCKLGMGVGRNQASSSERRRVRVDDSIESDPRVIHLPRSRRASI